MTKNSDKGEHEQEERAGKQDGNSPVPQPVKEAVREPKQVNAESPRPSVDKPPKG